VDQRAGDGDALLLAARELIGRLPAFSRARPTAAGRAPGSGIARTARSSGSSTFSSTVMVGSNWKNWKTKPMRVRRVAVSSASESELVARPSINTSQW